MIEKKELILIVDDNPQNIQFLGSLLTENGYKLGFAENGIQALEFVENREPSLILLDIMMPEMDGYEVCEKLKNDIRYKHISVIFITAKAETKDIVKGFDVGGVDYVTKPFIAEELLARVKTHVQMKTLKGLLPVCSSCKKIRDDKGYWNQIEGYIEKYSEVKFSHGICPECSDKLYGKEDWYIEIKNDQKNNK